RFISIRPGARTPPNKTATAIVASSTSRSAPRAAPPPGAASPAAFPGKTASRSEEHTSELQSLTNLVCRLLLEKKKNTSQRLIYGQKQLTSERTGSGASASAYTGHEQETRSATEQEHSGNLCDRPQRPACIIAV